MHEFILLDRLIFRVIFFVASLGFDFAKYH